MNLLLFFIGFSTLFGGIVDLPPVCDEPEEEEVLTYEQLPCSLEDREKIHYIITTIAENNWFSLIKRKGELHRKGDQIGHVHPLKFLASIFSDPNVKECMRKIAADRGMRYNKVLEDISSRLSIKMTLGQVEPHLEEFAKEVSVPVDSIKSYVQTHDWEGLLQLLINH